MKYILDSSNLSLLCVLNKLQRFLFQRCFVVVALLHEFVRFFKRQFRLIQALHANKVTMTEFESPCFRRKEPGLPFYEQKTGVSSTRALLS